MRSVLIALIGLAPSMVHAEDGPFCGSYVEEQSMLAACPSCRITVKEDPGAGSVDVVASMGWTATLTHLYPGGNNGEGEGKWSETADSEFAGETFDFSMGTSGEDWLSVTIVHHDPDRRYTINLGYRCAD